MPLDKAGLKNNIRAILDDLSTRVDDPEQAREDFAIALSNAIDAYVKTAKINYTNGLLAGNVAVTGVYNGNLS